MRKFFSSLGLLAVLVGGYYFYVYTTKHTIEFDFNANLDIPEAENPVLVGENDIHVIDQAAVAMEVTVDSLVASKSVFVVVKTVPLGGKESIIGISETKQRGNHDQFKVYMNRPMKSGETLYAEMYFDNGNRSLNLLEDSPVKNDQGEVISKAFQIQ
ncbi:MAG: hypothetical protein HY453_01670 [Parcubacteria group bacterium]|nr:hypothetical protein [Parcubacteria group bacterium]